MTTPEIASLNLPTSPTAAVNCSRIMYVIHEGSVHVTLYLGTHAHSLQGDPSQTLHLKSHVHSLQGDSLQTLYLGPHVSRVTSSQTLHAGSHIQSPGRPLPDPSQCFLIL